MSEISFILPKFHIKRFENNLVHSRTVFKLKRNIAPWW